MFVILLQFYQLSKAHAMLGLPHCMGSCCSFPLLLAIICLLHHTSTIRLPSAIVIAYKNEQYISVHVLITQSTAALRRKSSHHMSCCESHTELAISDAHMLLADLPNRINSMAIT